MRSNTTLRFRTLPVLAALALAGCGNGDDGAGGPGPGDASGLTDRSFDPNAMNSALYECTDADEFVYNLALAPDGTARLAEKDTPSVFTDGSYSITGESISLAFPELGVTESSNDHQVELGILGIFVTPNLYCHAVAFTNAAADPVVLECPLSNHIPDVSYEDDEIHLRANGNVFWRHWDHLVRANDEIYSAQNGIWIQEGNRVAMFFGSPFFEPTILTGTLDASGLRIDQFDSSGGICE